MSWGDSGIVLTVNTRDPVFVPQGASRVPWRLCTNFARAQDLLQRFGGWPDQLVPPLLLEALYDGKAEDEVPGLALRDGSVVRPVFPYLDDEEGARVGHVLEQAKPQIYPAFRLSLEEAGFSRARPADRELLGIQTLLVFSMRHAERESGIWELRSRSQKLGGVFALGIHVRAPFTRVSAFAAARGTRLAFPWGGPYAEYGKMLALMEHPHTWQILQSADDDLHVLAIGIVARSLILLDLVDTGSLFKMKEQQAKLNVDTAYAREMVRLLPHLARGVSSAAKGAAEALPALVDLWKGGRYSRSDGPGDYLEMAYSVLEGLLFQWAMADGLLSHPPVLTYSGENLVVRKSLLEQMAGRKAHFPGISALFEADVLWEELLRREKAA